MPSVSDPVQIHDFSTDTVVPPNSLETELEALREKIAAILDALEVTIRDDDQLRDAIVRYRCLHPEVVEALALTIMDQELITAEGIGAAAVGHTHLPAEAGADAAGTAAAEVAAHVAAADSHANYLNTTRGDARYSPLAHGHTPADVGADAAGTAAGLMASHEMDNSNPHATTAEQVGAVPLADVARAFTFNEDGTLASMTDTFGSKTYSYDERQRLIRVVGTGSYTSKTLHYTGDNLTSITID